MNRRAFFKLAGLASAAAAGGIMVAHRESFESLSFDRNSYRVSQSRQAMGTHVDVTAIGESRAATEDAVAAVFDDVHKMERLFTRYGNTSPVCELNAEGTMQHLPDELAVLLNACIDYHRETGGAFDITVKPCLDMFEAKSAQGLTPSDADIAALMPFLGTEKLQIRDNSLVIPQGMGITLDGAAPGFIADRAAQILQARGIGNFLVNAGGEIRTSGYARQGKDWRIAIQDPSGKGQYPGTIALKNAAVSTSGNYEIYYGDDKVFHHIVNAKTGRSPKSFASVTVTAPTALEADILSTALFVMEPQQALNFVESRPHLACLMVQNDGQILKSRRFIG